MTITKNDFLNQIISKIKSKINNDVETNTSQRRIIANGTINSQKDRLFMVYNHKLK